MSVRTLRNNAVTNNVGLCMPNVVLRSVLKVSDCKLNFCLINGGSLYPKIDQFRRIFESSNAHIVAAPETWFKSYRSNKMVSVDGYEVIRNDRHGKRSGGVAAYIKKGLKTKVIRSSTNIESEYLFFEVIFPNSKVLVGVYYKGPKVDEIDEVYDVLSELVPFYADVILMGDFNENMLVHDRNGVCSKCVLRTCGTCRLKSCFDRFGLALLGSAPTNFDGEPSQIDYVLTNSPSKISVFNQISSGLSNHDILFGSFVCRDLVEEDRPKYWRCFGEINVPSLLSDVSSSNMDGIYNCTNVNEMV